MSLLTTQESRPVFSTFLEPVFFSGKRKLGVSFWIRYTQRSNDNSMLFGSYEGYGSHTYLFNLNYSSVERVSFRVALEENGFRKYVFVVTSNLALRAWTHWWFVYEHGNLLVYRNGILDSKATCENLPLWNQKENYKLQLKGSVNALSTDYGEIAVFADDKLPTQVEMAAYVKTGVLPLGAILRYANVESPSLENPPILYDTGSANKPLVVDLPGGVLTDETSHLAPSIRLLATSAKILPGGSLLHTEWESIGGSTNFTAVPATGVYPRCFLRTSSGPDISVDLTKKICNKNIIRWVLPETIRAKSINEEYYVVFPQGAVLVDEASFSQGTSATPVNTFDSKRYSLPENPRAKLVAQGPDFRYYTPYHIVINAARIVGEWRGSTKFNVSGIPIACPEHPNTFTHASLYNWEGGSPKGKVNVMWQGLETSDVSFLTLKPTNDTRQVLYGGRMWFWRDYGLTGDPVSVAVKTDAEGNTGLTDLMIVRDDHWAQVVDDKKMAPEWLETNKHISILRHMDALSTITSNSRDKSHVVPENWLSVLKSENITADIIASEIRQDPDGYFPGNCTTVVLTTSKPHGMHSGQYVRLFPLSTYGSTAVCIRTDHLPDNQLECRISGSVTPGYVSSLVGGNIKLSIGYLPNPATIATEHNELFQKFGKCRACWVNRPHTTTDELWNWYLTELDRLLHPSIAIYVEYSNETYGYTTEQIVRYCVGEGKLLGLNEAQFYAEQTWQNYVRCKASITSGREYRVICAGQTVNPSILDARMLALKNIVGAALWTDFPVSMAVTTYHEFAPLTEVNQEGVLALDATGIAECYDFGLRAYDKYTPIKAKYGKPLLAYEGGFASGQQVVNIPLTRALIASAMVYETAEQTWHNFDLAQRAGFDAVCALPLRGRAIETPPKFWACAIGVDQQPGQDNDHALVEQYRVSGTPRPKDFKSVRLWAVNEWGRAGDKFGVVSYKSSAILEDGSKVYGLGKPTIEEANKSLLDLLQARGE